MEQLLTLMLLLGEIAIFIKVLLLGKKIETKKDVPTIGDEVWIGVNATIVSKVSIGDDVLIALMHLLIVIYHLIVWFLVILALLSTEIMRLKDI